MHDARTIFQRYEAIRHRLPKMPAGSPARRIGSLLDIANEVEAFVFDAFGVLNVGEALIPGADRRLSQLRAAGCKIRVLTNAASTAKPGTIAKFDRLGIALEPDEIISSRDAALRALDDRHWGVIAARSDDLSDVRHEVTRVDGLHDIGAAVEGIVFLSTADWSADQQARLEAALMDAPRPAIIANADLVAPRGATFSLEPGYFGHQIADRTQAEVRFFGKPFPQVFEMMEQGLDGVARDRIALCGDTLHTDILGAAAFGWRSVLVCQDGLFAGTDTEPFIQASGIHADWCLDRI